MYTTDHEALVAEAVLDLATRTYKYDALDLLHDLTAYMVSLLGVYAAGATILNEAGQVDYLTASNEVCRQLEEVQIELDEGPCVGSTRSGTLLTPLTLGPSSPGLRRWPRFTPRARRVDITSVAAVPLKAGRHTVGSVNLMSGGITMPTALDLRMAQALTAAAGAWPQHRRVLLSKDEIVEQLQTALQTRIVIEQAKGVLAARLGITVEDAFPRLRSYARARRMRLRDIATRVAQGDVPRELAAEARHADP